MPTFNIPANPLLDSFQKIYIELEGSSLKDEVINSCGDSINTATQFFQSKENEAILLALLLQLHFNGSAISMGQILEHVELPSSAAVYLNDLLKVFVERDWIHPQNSPQLFLKTEYEISRKLIYAVTSNDRSVLEKKREIPQSSFQLLELFEVEIRAKKRKKAASATLAKVSRELTERNPDLSLSKFIRKEKIQGELLPVFLKFCLDYYNGKDYVSPKNLAEDFIQSREERYRFISDFTQEKHPFFKKGLIKKVADDFIMSSDHFEYTDKVIQLIDPGASRSKSAVKYKMLEKIEASTIAEKMLIYPLEQQASVEKLQTLMMPEQFDKFTGRFRAKGMKAGVSILLYGKPGTGKTETVLQLSRATGRSLLTADASKIRDKWVGETEKNIRELFQEYRKSLKESKHCPILLFNEADAVFGVRRKVNDRGDQMENSLQNILLEELENFEGIFIATTNMETNFDKAFDRRFLYKFKFEIPSATTTRAIWESKFPGMDQQIIHVLSEEFSLTGAQIENIRKKTEVDLILNEETSHDLAYFKKLAREELRLQKNTDAVQRSIGFVKRSDS